MAATPTQASVLAEIAALSCNGTFSADRGKINDDTFALINAGVTSQELGAISDAFSARLRALNYCVGGPTTPPATTTPAAETSAPATEAPAPAAASQRNSQTTTIDLDDDGSAARVSGSQIADVPEGSVNTGAP